MTISADTALQKISRYISAEPIAASVQSLEFIRDALIDTYGCMLIGSRQAVTRKTHQALINCGHISGQGRARIYGTDYHATPGAAAMANAVSGHALEFDDWEVPGNTHISVLLFPAILAAGCRVAQQSRPILPDTKPSPASAKPSTWSITTRAGMRPPPSARSASPPRWRA
jgi:2-methylcitrate dehydratase PrpD